MLLRTLFQNFTLVFHLCKTYKIILHKFKEIETVMSGSPAGFRCNFADCTRTYELKQNLTRHINEVHKQSKIKCNLCEARL